MDLLSGTCRFRGNQRLDSMSSKAPISDTLAIGNRDQQRAIRDNGMPSEVANEETDRW